MTLKEIVEQHGFNQVARRTEGQSEAIRIVKELDMVYEVQGIQTDMTYTEKQDADGYEHVPFIGKLKSQKTPIA